MKGAEGEKNDENEDVLKIFQDNYSKKKRERIGGIDKAMDKVATVSEELDDEDSKEEMKGIKDDEN